jgi:spermidine synthase
MYIISSSRLMSTQEPWACVAPACIALSVLALSLALILWRITRTKLAHAREMYQDAVVFHAATGDAREGPKVDMGEEGVGVHEEGNGTGTGTGTDTDTDTDTGPRVDMGGGVGGSIEHPAAAAPLAGATDSAVRSPPSSPDHASATGTGASDQVLRLQEVAMDELHSHQSDAQRIAVADTKDPRLGRCLLLDGAVQLCDADEHRYHEMLVHFPARYLEGGGPRRALVIGGGDCMALRELTKYESMERVVVVEPDPDLVSVSQQHLGAEALHGDPRVTWLMGRGEAGLGIDTLFSSAYHKAAYDFIIIDGKERPAPLFEEDDDATYASLATLLSPSGVLVRNGEQHQGALAQHFSNTLVFKFHSDTFGREVSMVMCSADVDLRVRNIDIDSMARQHIITRFYDPTRHFLHVPWAAFAAIKRVAVNNGSKFPEKVEKWSHKLSVQRGIERRAQKALLRQQKLELEQKQSTKLTSG